MGTVELYPEANGCLKCHGIERNGFSAPNKKKKKKLAFSLGMEKNI